MSFFERYSKSQGKSSQAKEWFEKGEKYFGSQEYDKAIEAYTSAISLDPNYLEAYFKRGQTRYIKQEVKPALDDIERALSIDPKHIGSLLVRGLIYVGEKQQEKIIDSFNQLLSVEPDNEMALSQRGFAYRQTEHFDRAIEDLSKSLSVNSNNEIVYFERGLSYASKNQLDLSIKDFDKAISIKPDYAEVYTTRGIAYAQLGDAEKALSDLQKGSQLGDKTADEYLKELNINTGGQRMHSVDMNKNLWKDKKYFDDFLRATSLLSKAASKEAINPKEILDITNMLDDLMQDYENRYGSVDDPIFFWYFATANATLLQVGKEFDELGSARIGYIVNGYREGLNKHLLYPSYPAQMINAAIENMEQFANDHDKKWIIANRDKFNPIPG